MKLTTTTQVPVGGVAQGNGGPDENRSGGFERGGWARPLFDSEAMTVVNQVYRSRYCIATSRTADPQRVPRSMSLSVSVVCR